MLYHENLGANYILLDNQDNQDNQNSRRFIYLFNLKTLAVNCCCGLPLRLGVQSIAVYFLFLAFFQIICAVSGDDTPYIIFSVVKSAFYLFIGSILFSSVVNKCIEHANIGYVTNIIALVANLVETPFIFYFIVTGERDVNLGFISVQYSKRFAVVVALSFLLIEMVIQFIHVYLIYIIYSYMIHMEKGNIHLINGYEPPQPLSWQEIDLPSVVNKDNVKISSKDNKVEVKLDVKAD